MIHEMADSELVSPMALDVVKDENKKRELSKPKFEKYNSDIEMDESDFSEPSDEFKEIEETKK